MKHGWEVLETDAGDLRVIPENDLRPHVKAWACWCAPFDDDGICTHNAMDKRELIERGEAMKQ